MRFDQFELALRRDWGDEVAQVRHEIYFMASRSNGWRQKLRALAALARDAWTCLWLPDTTEPLHGVIAAVSLVGANGWGAVSQLAGSATATVVAHPRLEQFFPGGDHNLRRPGLAAWRAALDALWHEGGGGPAGVWSGTVRCALARHRLWRGVWQRTLANGEIRTILLHNDFDMFSAAAVAAARQSRVTTICVQHGLPTDEFFPARADVQLVWGESSRNVYAARGVAAERLVMGTPRRLTDDRVAVSASLPPEGLLLISQTHTPVFGRSLVPDFLALAAALAATAAGEGFVILLHPEESRLGNPYPAQLQGRCRNGPHGELAPVQTESPALVVGFCSTALIEAALAGHYVLGVDWPVPAGGGALAVGSPPQRAIDAAEVARCLARLSADEGYRRDWLRRQADWLEATLAPLATTWLAECLSKTEASATVNEW